jgi:CRP-like cAMP-binding protein
LITSVSIFRDLDPTAMHEISLLAKPQAFDEGELIVRQGGKTDDFYIISEGRVRIFRSGAGSREPFSVVLGPGEFFGENVAMGYTDRRNATAQAQTAVQTLVISGRELRSLATRMPILRHKMHLIMKGRGVGDEVLERALIDGQDLQGAGA